MTSSLTSLPSTSSHESLASIIAAPPAIRRTYGRQRPVTPPLDDEPAISLFRPTEDFVVTESRRIRPARASGDLVSPAKNLLNRFSEASTSWHNSLDLLDADREEQPESVHELAKGKRGGLFDFAPGSKHRSYSTAGGDSDRDDDKEDDEAIKAEMERMRRELRGDGLSSSSVRISATVKSGDAVPSEAQSKRNDTALQVPRRAIMAAASSSSLSSAPPSSPPRVNDDVEAMRVRRSGIAGPSGRVKRVIISDTEDDGPKSSQTASKDDSSFAGAPEQVSHRVEIDGEDERIPSLLAALAEDDDTAPDTARNADFFKSLQAEEEAEIAKEKTGTRSNPELLDLFDEDELPESTAPPKQNIKVERSL